MRTGQLEPRADLKFQPSVTRLSINQLLIYPFIYLSFSTYRLSFGLYAYSSIHLCVSPSFISCIGLFFNMDSVLPDPIHPSTYIIFPISMFINGSIYHY